jgi:hypothetical protein
LAATYTLSINTSGLQIRQTPVIDLASRVSPPPPPEAAPRAPKWWEEELAARQDPGATPFEAEDTLTGLSDEDRLSARGEALSVYQACEQQDFFATTHNCRCIAERVFEIQAERYISGAADFVTNFEPNNAAREVQDLCPNMAGTAAHMYGDCESNYGARFPDDPDGLDEYCTCYATHIANDYEDAPASDYQSLVGSSANALLACEELAPGN